MIEKPDLTRVPVFILCGGLGTRLKEETEFRPKPMVPIGKRPILWHIMRTYANMGSSGSCSAWGSRRITSRITSATGTFTTRTAPSTQEQRSRHPRTDAGLGLGSDPRLHGRAEHDRQPHRPSRAQISRPGGACSPSPTAMASPMRIWPRNSTFISLIRTRHRARRQSALPLREIKLKATTSWVSPRSRTSRTNGSTAATFSFHRDFLRYLTRMSPACSNATARASGARPTTQHLQAPRLLGLHGHPARP